jgi:uncharacterized membrane protein
MSSTLRWPEAILAGLACSMRSSAGPALLAARGRISGKPRILVLLMAAGELIADKTPVATDRTDPPAVAGRVASGAYTGRAIAGVPGAVVAAASAAVGTFATYQARKLAVQASGLPDPVVAVGEDLLAVTAAAVATRPAPAAA